MPKSKIETYIGFAIKSRKVTCGFNSIESLNKGVYLLILCSSASENSLKLAEKLQHKLKCKLMVCNDIKLEDVTHKPNSKIIGIRDENLAKAICDNEDANFKLYSGGRS